MDLFAYRFSTGRTGSSVPEFAEENEVDPDKFSISLDSDSGLLSAPDGVVFVSVSLSPC